jgi:hypothetical protein
MCRVKHKAKLIMNQTYVDHDMCKLKGSYGYSSTVGGFYIYKRHYFPPTLEEEA